MNPAIPPFCNYLYEKSSIGGMRPVQIVRQGKDCHGVPGRLRAGTASFGKMPKDVTAEPASFGKTPKEGTPCGGRRQQGAQFLRLTCGTDLLQRRKMRIIVETRMR